MNVCYMFSLVFAEWVPCILNNCGGIGKLRMKNCLRDLAIKIHYQGFVIVAIHAKENIYGLFVIVIYKVKKTYRKDLNLSSSQCPLILAQQFQFF